VEFAAFSERKEKKMTIKAWYNGGSVRPVAAVVMGLAVAGALNGGAACAGEGTFSGDVTVASQYIFRGVSRSDGDPAVQGSLSYNLKGYHAGVFGSSGKFGNDGNAEVDLSAGYGFQAKGFDYDLTLVGYTFPGDGVDNSVEVLGTVGRDFGLVAGTVGVGYTPAGQQAFLGHDVKYVFADMDVPIPNSRFTASFHVGYQDFGPTTRTHWSAGLFTTLAGLNVGLQYVDTDKKGPGLGARALFTVAKYF
jgi:uncharacterized protein (TIGR02001 family)